VDYGASLENWFPPGTMGSNPIPCATTQILCVYDTFIKYLTEVRENKLITAKNKQIIINALTKRVSNLWNSEEVEQYIKTCDLSNGRKNLYGQAYRDWCNWKGFDFKPKHYKKEEKLPYIPTEQEIDQLIGDQGKKMALFLQIMKESAFRPSETQRLTPDDFNLETRICTLNKPSKNSRPRQFKMSEKLISMLVPYLHSTKSTQRIFSGKLKTIRTQFYRRRKTLAKRMGNPNLLRITFKTLRHWKATMTHHQTKDLLYTQKILGHKSIKNTMIYAHLVFFEEEDSFIVKVASNLEEYIKLLESGFEYISDYEDKKILRKRK